MGITFGHQGDWEARPPTDAPLVCREETCALTVASEYEGASDMADRLNARIQA